MKSALLGQPNFSVKPFRFYEPVFRIQFPESIFDFNFSVFDGFSKRFLSLKPRMMISIQYFWSSSCVLLNAMEQLLSFTTTVAFNDGYSHLVSQGLTISLFNYRANQI